jgi:hypothetical protein
VVIIYEQVGVIILGTIFLFIGVAACCIAAIRDHGAGRILPWFGIFSAMYGVRLFAEVPAAFSLLVGPFWPHAPQLVWIITYVILIPALLSWAELSLGTQRRFLQLMVFPVSVLAIGGIFATLLHRSPPTTDADSDPNTPPRSWPGRNLTHSITPLHRPARSSCRNTRTQTRRILPSSLNRQMHTSRRA